jgi:hypothetical protein
VPDAVRRYRAVHLAFRDQSAYHRRRIHGGRPRSLTSEPWLSTR